MERFLKAEAEHHHAMDFTNMSPDDVVRVCLTIDALPSQQFALKGEMTDAFFYGLDYLARRHAALAAATYRELAVNKDVSARRSAAISISGYAGYDKYHALPLWSALLHDEDRSTRQCAAESIVHATNEGCITSSEAAQLARLVMEPEDLDNV